MLSGRGARASGSGLFLVLWKPKVRVSEVVKVRSFSSRPVSYDPRRIQALRQFLVGCQAFGVPVRYQHSDTSNLAPISTPAPELLGTSQASATAVSSLSPDSSTTQTPVDIETLNITIPDPPAPIDDSLITTGSATSDIVYNALGEPTLASLGLGSWWPPGIVQQCLEMLHVNLGMPWWAAILTGTVIIRLCLFPLVIKSQRNAAKMSNNMPGMQQLQLKISEARQTGDSLMAAKYTNDLMIFMKEKDISPFKSMMVPLAMAPVFISFFFGLRKMANLPVESLRDGGLLWFSDLTIADPYYILPLITSATLWVTLEIGADGVKMTSSPHGNIMKYALRVIPVIVFPMTMNFPAALLCYWVSTNTVSLLQVSLLKIPTMRERFGIESIRKVEPTDLPIKNKGFMKSAKESWTNMRLTQEMTDRERYDEIQFKRAGRGPLPKTYKYNPVAAAAAAGEKIQAKSK